MLANLQLVSSDVIKDALFFPRLIDCGENELKISQLCLKSHFSMKTI